MTRAPVLFQAQFGQAELHPTIAVTLHPARILERPRPSSGHRASRAFGEKELVSLGRLLEVCPFISWLSRAISEGRRNHVAELLPMEVF